jgi:23S rRNA maturation mini-RNase III
MKGERPPDVVAIEAWWNAVLAGGVDEPHPVHGDDLTISIGHGVLHLAGTLQAEEDRNELLAGARAFVGHGIDAVDARHLKVTKRSERPGILEQTLIAAFRNRAVAELARDYLVGIRRLKAKEIEIVDRGHEAKARRLLSADFMPDIQKAFKHGDVVLFVRVDETEAFKVREMLAQDTRSRWTVATPPSMASKAGS